MNTGRNIFLAIEILLLLLVAIFVLRRALRRKEYE